MRAGGKHNDLDNVGKTARHHTLFEMLGNFAFSDATDAAEAQRAASCGEPSPLKAESIVNAWDFLTQVVMLPPERLRVTVHEEDKDSAQIWRNVIGLSDSQVVLGREDNWWSMGNGAGPVGPCSEIFWDQQREVDGEQWLELWNLVFMEQMRCADGTLSSLPRPCVDTGMGLERLASVLQGVRPSAQTQSDSRAAVQCSITRQFNAGSTAVARATRRYHQTTTSTLSSRYSWHLQNSPALRTARMTGQEAILRKLLPHER
eukprot:SAG25_NODE_204_length_11947_cov_29.018822_12_plen_260_part_00